MQLSDRTKGILFLLLCVCSSLMSFAQLGKIFETQMPCRLLQDVSRRALTIYLPPSYEQDSQRRYPVLYLMHGGGESHTVWQRNGHLREVADSLIATGEMEEMILVCPEGNEQNMMYFNAPWWKYEAEVPPRSMASTTRSSSRWSMTSAATCAVCPWSG